MSLEFRILCTQVREMLGREGVYLPSLEPGQQFQGDFGDKRSERVVQTQVSEERTEGEAIMEQPHQTQTHVEPPPAGGESEAKAFADLIRKASRQIANEPDKRTYGQKALDAAIPSAVYMGGILLTYVGATIISNRWGATGLRRKELELKERALDGSSANALEEG